MINISVLVWKSADSSKNYPLSLSFAVKSHVVFATTDKNTGT
jgi:hypothetical protein